MSLPKKVKIPVEILTDDANGDCSVIADYLSDKYGFCVISLIVEKDMAVDIVWDTTD